MCAAPRFRPVGEAPENRLGGASARGTRLESRRLAMRDTGSRSSSARPLWGFRFRSCSRSPAIRAVHNRQSRLSGRRSSGRGLRASPFHREARDASSTLYVDPLSYAPFHRCAPPRIWGELVADISKEAVQLPLVGLRPRLDWKLD